MKTLLATVVFNFLNMLVIAQGITLGFNSTASGRNVTAQ